MKQPLLAAGRRCLAHCVRVLPRVWREPAPQFRPASRGMQLSLRPSPCLRRLRYLLVALQLLYVAHLLLLGHWYIGAAVAALSLAFAWAIRSGRSQPSWIPSQLLVGADGRLHLMDAAGQVEPVALQACSLRLGPWLLLVLTHRAGTCRLLLGPDNVEASQLAALRRRVLAPVQRPGGTR